MNSGDGEPPLGIPDRSGVDGSYLRKEVGATSVLGPIMIASVGFNLVQVVVVMLFEPLLAGMVSRLKEIEQSKR